MTHNKSFFALELTNKEDTIQFQTVSLQRPWLMVFIMLPHFQILFQNLKIAQRLNKPLASPSSGVCWVHVDVYLFIDGPLFLCLVGLSLT